MEKQRSKRSWLTPPEVAERMEVSDATVRAWCEVGALGHRVAGRWRITEQHLRDFQERGFAKNR